MATEKFVQAGFQAGTGTIASMGGGPYGLIATAGALVLSGVSALLYNPSEPRPITITELEEMVKGSQEHVTPMGMVGGQPVGRPYAVIVSDGYKPTKQIASILSATSVIKSAEDFGKPLPIPHPVVSDIPIAWIGEAETPTTNPGLMNIIPSTVDVGDLPAGNLLPSGISLDRGIASSMEASPISESPLKEIHYDYSLIMAAVILLIIMVIL